MKLISSGSKAEKIIMAFLIMVIWLLAMVLIDILAELLIPQTVIADTGIPFDLYDLILYFIANIFAEAAVLVVVYLYNKKTLTSAISVKGFDPALLICLLFLCWTVGEISDNIIGYIMSGFITVEPNTEPESTAAEFISAVICAPVFEEILFRFSLFAVLKDKFGMKFCVIVTTLVFALFHAYNFQGISNVFFATIFSAYVYYKTGNILYTVTEHALHNLLCFISFDKFFESIGIPVYYEKNGFVLSYLPWICFWVICFILMMIWFVKLMKKNRQEERTVYPEQDILL